MRALTFILPAALAAVLCAQEKPLDLAVAYPATSLVYAEANLPALGDYASFRQVLAGLAGHDGADPVSQLVAKLDLSLDKAQIEALSANTLRASVALVDITVRGVKLQIVIEHKDLTVLDKALREASRLERASFEGVEEYEGTTIHKLRLSNQRNEEAGFFGEISPLSGMLSEFEFGAAVYKNRYLVLAPNVSGAKDAIDGLMFPEDPLDTLLGNRRYREAFQDFKDPGAQLFVNIEAVLNTVERIAGDKPDQDMLGWFLRSMLPQVSIDPALAGSLTQYNQLKGFSAALWMPRAADDSEMQARVEARLSFHNTPGWLDALRATPQPMPLLDVIPSDAVLALTANVQDSEKLYRQCREFVQSRAREAGKPEAVKDMEIFEPGIEADLKPLWKFATGGVAAVIVPTSMDMTTLIFGQVAGAFVVEVNDLRSAEESLYDSLLKHKMLRSLRQAEGALAPVEILNGVEIHASSDGGVAFAFLAGEGKAGTFLAGEVRAVRHIVAMQARGSTLRSIPAFARARGHMWDKHNTGVYINGGAALEAVAGIYSAISSFNPWGDEDEEGPADRDDAEALRNPVPRLAKFFSGSAIVGAQRSGATVIEFRFSAAGIPGSARFAELAAQYRDVQRNFEVRDDLLRVREAAATWYALRGEPAANVDALTEAGYLVKAEWAIDPFDPAGTRRYALAPVPRDVDIRQAVLLAHQAQPGLEGKHLAVLWNGHVVALTPEQMKAALDRASRGEALDETMYSVPLRPLHQTRAERGGVSGRGGFEVRRNVAMLDVVIIDDEGEEEAIEVPQRNAMDELEKTLNERATTTPEPKPPAEKPEAEPEAEPK